MKNLIKSVLLLMVTAFIIVFGTIYDNTIASNLIPYITAILFLLYGLAMVLVVLVTIHIDDAPEDVVEKLKEARILVPHYGKIYIAILFLFSVLLAIYGFTGSSIAFFIITIMQSVTFLCEKIIFTE